MKICPNCGWENDDDFNFCLGCGSQLPDQMASVPVVPSPAPAPSQPPVTAVPASAPGHVKSDTSPPPAGDGTRPCPQCGAPVPPNFLFCGQCGFRMEVQQAAPPAAPVPVAVPASPARLVLLLPNGQEGGSYPLKPDATEIGRTKGNILFLDDPFVSPLHATFQFQGKQLTVHNQDSLNGLFMRLSQSVQLKHNDVLLLGKQLLRFEVLESTDDEVFDPLDAGTTPQWGSPYRPYWARIVQLIAGGMEGNSILLGGTSVELGRERGQITFPGDRFISSIHARISHNNGMFTLEDLGSRNGTFICVRDQYQLNHNDILIIGEQLLRVEMSA